MYDKVANHVAWLVTFGWDRREVYEALTQIGARSLGNMGDAYLVRI